MSEDRLRTLALNEDPCNPSSLTAAVLWLAAEIRALREEHRPERHAEMLQAENAAGERLR